jgi:hypothetical protein
LEEMCEGTGRRELGSRVRDLTEGVPLRGVRMSMGVLKSP